MKTVETNETIEGNSSSGGGFGKWLRDHLGGSLKGSHDINTTKSNGAVKIYENEKNVGKHTYTSQNLYCSLPREHGRHYHNGNRKSVNISPKLPVHDRPRTNSPSLHEKSYSGDLGNLTRGGPFYGSEGKSVRKRHKDRRRHSMNDVHDQNRYRRKR